MRKTYEVNKDYRIQDVHEHTDGPVSMVIEILTGKSKGDLYFVNRLHIVEGEEPSVEYDQYLVTGLNVEAENPMDNLGSMTKDQSKVLEKCIRNFIDISIEYAIGKRKDEEAVEVGNVNDAKQDT